MESPAKKCRIIRVKVAKRKRKVDLNTLNMKCTGAILKWLPIEDLYSVSCTSKSMQKLAGLQYQQGYPNSLVTIELTADKRIQSQYEGKFDLHFSANIRNVTMTSYIFDQSPVPLFEYLKMNCCQHLKELNLYRLKLATGIDYGASIKGQLRTLETIAFNGCMVTDLHRQFLKYCHHMKHLRIKDKKFNANCNDSWMRHTYAELNSLTFWGCDSGNYSSICTFLGMNRGVKNINCMGIDVLKIILNNANDLDNLVIHCEAPEDLDTIQRLLIQHSTLGVFKRFELVFHFTSEINRVPKNVKSIHSLSSLAANHGFHGLFTTDTVLVDCVLKSLINLRSLSIKLALEHETNTWTLAQYLPQLDDVRLYITYSLHHFGATFKPLTQPFLLTSKKLKQIIVSFTINSCVTHRNDIIDLNNLRLKSKGACATTIYLSSDVIIESKFTMPTGGLVHVKPISQLSRKLYLDPFLF